MRREDLLDLNDVLQHPGRKLAVDISTELAEEADLDLIQPLEGFLEAVSTGNILLVTGKFKARVVLECARCTSAIEVDVDFEVDEQFSVVGTPSSFNSQDYARVEADEPFEMFDGNSLVVEALLRQDLFLAMPMQPLCAHGWEGDCPTAAGKKQSAKPGSEGRPEFSKLARLLGGEGTPD